ncbi:MAG: hypothetical protein AB7I41_02310 [Candidatus Sericytochromatia bacterium]
MNPLRPASPQLTSSKSSPVPALQTTGKPASVSPKGTGHALNTDRLTQENSPDSGPSAHAAHGSSRPSQSLGLDGPPAQNFPRWNFPAKQFPGFYPAGKDRSPAYHFDKILKDLPQIWARPWSGDLSVGKGKPLSSETYGELFKRIGAETGTDPFALATYCIFESYHSGRQTFNPRMQEIGGGMHAAGIAATQAQDWKGKKIPGTNQRFPATVKATASVLRAHPEYGLRCLAAEFKQTYAKKGQDLARTFPGVAYPAWKNPAESKGNYGTQAQYVSRAFALYQGFQAADQGP